MKSPLPDAVDDRLPRYHRLRDDLKGRIAAGAWRPDEPIPTEIELARTYGVAIGTVRKAVDMLVQEGLLLRSQGRGTFLRRPRFDRSFFRFFRQVDAAGVRSVPVSRILSQAVEQPGERVRQALGLAPEQSVLRLKRRRSMEAGSVIHEDIWLPADRFVALQALQPDEYGNLLYPLYEEKCGEIVASARETLTIEPADAVLAAELGIEAGKPVAVIERIALGYDQLPIEYRLSRGAAEHFRYQIDIA
ncbi:MAG: GntR family transcriptional regulator [Corticimicrobacter sp.]|uniref:GntR family transcriptional regulator n=1 Tax=Corticimicrobacter sp. TaxID=2678536 RepID=UPI0032D9BB22